jgi:small-conductance mechanosensitive channel
MIEPINKLADWVTNNGLEFLFIILFGLLIKRFGKIFIERVVRSSVPASKNDAFEKTQRENTLIGIFYGIMNVAWWGIVAMLILDLIGINLGPLIAGAGVAGVALGFGGQWLIRDLISGTFIILENQFRVGDVVSLNTGSGIVTGVVEEIDLRMSLLRDLDGQLHHVPNGSIVVATNMSKTFSGINLDISVGYETDIDKLIDIVDKVGIEIKDDEVWANKIIETPSFLRINEFGENGIVIKITGKTEPLEQWAVAGELRKRLKMAFDKAQIDIPYPQRVIHEQRN